jgi:adenine phosphoribosyltransferase
MEMISEVVNMDVSEQIKQTVREIPDFPKPGILFKDITPLLENQKLCSAITQEFIKQLPERPDAIVGIESRGFLFGFLVANAMNIPFILVRKSGKLPYKTIRHEYALEYGTSVVEMHTDSIKKGWKVMIHDDLLATGGTAEAAANLVEKQGANVCAFTFVIGLGFLNGKEKLLKHTNNIICLAQY